jgi:hypothetical protein
MFFTLRTGGLISMGETETVREQDICDICGRTLLTGENLEPEEGGKVVVCPICRSDARRCGYRQVA